MKPTIASTCRAIDSRARGGEAGRVLGRGVGGHVVEVDAHREIRQRVVGRVWSVTMSIGGALGEHPRQQLGGVAEQADGERPAGVTGLDGELEGVLQAVGLHVEVPVLDAALDRAGVESMQIATPSFMVTASGWAPPMPPRPAVRVIVPGQRAAELLGGDGGEGLVGALEDALGADVDPRTGGHLPVHGQPEDLQATELLPVGPVADEVGVGDEDARGPLVGLHDADRPAGLDQHRLVLLQGPERADHGVEGAPVAGRLAGAAVDDELVGVLGDLRVEVVLQHPQGGFLLPSQGAQFRTARRSYGAGS